MYTTFPIVLKNRPTRLATHCTECFDLNPDSEDIKQILYNPDDLEGPKDWRDYGAYVKPWNPFNSHKQTQNFPNCMVVYYDHPDLIRLCGTPYVLVIAARSIGAYLISRSQTQFVLKLV